MASGVKGMSTQPRDVPVGDGGHGFWSHTVGVCTHLANPQSRGLS